MIRPLTPQDLPDARRLYRTLTGEAPLGDAAAFEQVLAHPGTTIFGAQHQGHIVSMATLHLLPNMTFDARPYGLVENVATLRAHQGQGFGRAVMTHLADSAWAHNAYKLMLLTGTELGARGFYEALGYNGDQKHAMILRRAPQRQPPPQD
ncbi:MAG: GNAT family N-acetyltransferase [Sedimentitalea sp.]